MEWLIDLLWIILVIILDIWFLTTDWDGRITSVKKYPKKMVGVN